MVEAPPDESIRDFYDDLAAQYHLIFEDWDASRARQGRQIQEIIRTFWPTGEIQRVLDVACGIGTQALALAEVGYQVSASDLSSGAVARAQHEAEVRSLPIAFSVSDMREVSRIHGTGLYDLVLCADNSLPHLLSDSDIRIALCEFYNCVRPGGGCLITVRDYAHEACTGTQIKPVGVRQDKSGNRVVLFQVWEFLKGDFDGPVYDLALYLAQDTGAVSLTGSIFRSRYYAISLERLAALMCEAGFEDVTIQLDVFYQPVLLGRVPQLPGIESALL